MVIIVRLIKGYWEMVREYRPMIKATHWPTLSKHKGITHAHFMFHIIILDSDIQYQELGKRLREEHTSGWRGLGLKTQT